MCSEMSRASKTLIFLIIYALACADPEGGGVRTSLKNHKNIGFPSNTGPDPLKNHKATEPEFNIEPSSPRQRNAI